MPPLGGAGDAAAVETPAAAVAASDSWTQWRGPERDGTFLGPTWPDSFDGTLEKVWHQKIGEGYSSPMVTEDAVFTFETQNRKREIVRAFDRKTGEPKWETGWDDAMSVPFFARANGSWVRATPVVDGDRLYVGGIRDVLVCLDTATGRQLWRVDFKKRNAAPNPKFGMVCSPVVRGDHLYVQAGGGLTKLDKMTGETVWDSLKDGGGMSGSAFSSPIFAEIAGRDMLLVQTRSMLTAVNPETGKVIWGKKIEAFRGMNIQTPTVIGDKVFTSSYGGGSFLIDVKRENGTVTSDIEWQTKTEGYMSSPILIGDHIYMHLRNERFACLDLKTGDRVWSSPKSLGKYMSLLRQGDRILGLTERGKLLLIDANPKAYTVIDDHQLIDAQTWAHVAMAGNEIVVRDLKGIGVWRWEK